MVNSRQKYNRERKKEPDLDQQELYEKYSSRVPVGKNTGRLNVSIKQELLPGEGLHGKPLVDFDPGILNVS